jgi:hypothetical protein
VAVRAGRPIELSQQFPTGMKKKRRGGRTQKPRGKMGHLQLGSAKDPGSVEFVPIELPRSKPEIEEWILAAALSAAGKATLKLYDLTGEPVQNREQDFDFTLPTPRGAEFLDLVELAPLQALAGQYDNARSAYRIGDIAEQAYRPIRAKSHHYRAVNSPCTMHLLAYTTDWRLRLPKPAQNLIRFWLSTEPHGFRTISYFAPDSADDGEISILYPTPHTALDGFNEADVANTPVVSIDLSAPTILPDGSVEFRLPPLQPPKPGKPVSIVIRHRRASEE